MHTLCRLVGSEKLSASRCTNQRFASLWSGKRAVSPALPLRPRPPPRPPAMCAKMNSESHLTTADRHWASMAPSSPALPLRPRPPSLPPAASATGWRSPETPSPAWTRAAVTPLGGTAASSRSAAVQETQTCRCEDRKTMCVNGCSRFTPRITCRRVKQRWQLLPRSKSSILCAAIQTCSDGSVCYAAPYLLPQAFGACRALRRVAGRLADQRRPRGLQCINLPLKAARFVIKHFSHTLSCLQVRL